MIRPADKRDDMTPERAARVGLQQLLLRSVDAAAVCGVSERTWRRWSATGLVPAPLRIGGMSRWNYAELAAWASAGSPSRERWGEMKNAAKLGKASQRPVYCDDKL